ncbi:MAG: nucleotidyl transferase AbiEii/AbiGii toxin family protein [Candidatus Omnitrophica bacterium]|nr:nucleotidyl transferase AbiEii/AbiGii toxin family protein [Candidatus Omnitrophota bacterium]
MYDPLQLREIFHLEFLRRFGQKVEGNRYALKGGVNLRLFFNSFRYSEDIDVDVSGVGVETLKRTVMKIIEARVFQETLRSFGIARVIAPDIAKAKQTETTQRFKMHLLTDSGEDLFTQVEFSRRGWSGRAIVEPVSNRVLRAYQMAPLLISHYDVLSAIRQKIEALAGRSILQARDVFDLYLLSSQVDPVLRTGAKEARALKTLDKSRFEKAHHRLFEIDYEQFRDTVVSYLAEEDQVLYEAKSSWDELQLRAAHFIEELKEKK